MATPENHIRHIIVPTDRTSNVERALLPDRFVPLEGDSRIARSFLTQNMSVPRGMVGASRYNSQDLVMQIDEALNSPVISTARFGHNREYFSGIAYGEAKYLKIEGETQKVLIIGGLVLGPSNQGRPQRARGLINQMLDESYSDYIQINKVKESRLQFFEGILGPGMIKTLSDQFADRAFKVTPKNKFIDYASPAKSNSKKWQTDRKESLYNLTVSKEDFMVNNT